MLVIWTQREGRCGRCRSKTWGNLNLSLISGNVFPPPCFRSAWGQVLLVFLMRLLHLSYVQADREGRCCAGCARLHPGCSCCNELIPWAAGCFQQANFKRAHKQKLHPLAAWNCSVTKHSSFKCWSKKPPRQKSIIDSSCNTSPYSWPSLSLQRQRGQGMLQCQCLCGKGVNSSLCV